jgi:hypothetical protein
VLWIRRTVRRWRLHRVRQVVPRAGAAPAHGRGLSPTPPLPETRGSAPGPRWRASPQTLPQPGGWVGDRWRPRPSHEQNAPGRRWYRPLRSGVCRLPTSFVS